MKQRQSLPWPSHQGSAARCGRWDEEGRWSDCCRAPQLEFGKPFPERWATSSGPQNNAKTPGSIWDSATLDSPKVDPILRSTTSKLQDGIPNFISSLQEKWCSWNWPSSLQGASADPQTVTLGCSLSSLSWSPKRAKTSRILSRFMEMKKLEQQKLVPGHPDLLQKLGKTMWKGQKMLDLNNTGVYKGKLKAKVLRPFRGS